MSLTIRVPENVYRYPYEFLSAAAYSAAAFAAAQMPMPGFSPYIAIPAMTLMALKRSQEGNRIRRYRKKCKKSALLCRYAGSDSSFRQGIVSR